MRRGGANSQRRKCRSGTRSTKWSGWRWLTTIASSVLGSSVPASLANVPCPRSSRRRRVAVRDQIRRAHGARSVRVCRSRTDHGEVECVRAGVHASRVLGPRCDASRLRAPAARDQSSPSSSLGPPWSPGPPGPPPDSVLATGATVLVRFAAAGGGWRGRLLLRRGRLLLRRGIGRRCLGRLRWLRCQTRLRLFGGSGWPACPPSTWSGPLTP